MMDLAVVGAGFMGENHARAAADHPALSLEYVADIDAERAGSVADACGATGVTDYESIVDDVDAVIVSSPPPVHFEQARTVLEADRHLLLEKPIALTRDDAATLASIAADTDAVTATGFLLRHTPEYARTRELAIGGEIGDIVAARAKRAIATDTDGGASLHGHPLLYLNIHDIDAFHFCLDADVVEVVGNERWGALREMDVPDATHALLTFDSGAIGVLEGYGVLPGDYPDEITASFELTGEAGTTSISFPGDALTTHTDRFTRHDTRLWPAVNGRMSGAVREQLDHVVSTIRSGGISIATIEDGYRAIVVVDAITRAIETDDSVSVEY